jgi:uncharacterized protein YjbI with pentapeptide repeats
VKIDLRDADLSGVSLVAINLSGAHLVNANLNGAQLIGVNFEMANLFGANLRQADLSDSILARTHLGTANLSGADFGTNALLHHASLQAANLSGATLVSANLAETNLYEAKLIETNLSGANLTLADLRRGNLRGADLNGTALNGANFFEANLQGANLRGADLQGATLSKTDLRGADISNCRVYGVSAWNPITEGTIQSNLIITENDEPEITVDNLEVAQFVYLLLHNQNLRDVIDTVGKKAVLILGRFTEERLEVLEALKEELRKLDYVPILFKFQKPARRNLMQTVMTLALLSRFIVADLTSAKVVIQELERIVPSLRAVPVQPIVLRRSRMYATFDEMRKDYHWLLEPYRYDNKDHLVATLYEKVIEPVEVKVKEIHS